jgi:hypothetical protein
MHNGDQNMSVEHKFVCKKVESAIPDFMSWNGLALAQYVGSVA